MGLEFLFSGVMRFVLAGTTGKEDDARAVSAEAGDVCGEGFSAEVGAAGVDADADGGGEFSGDACFLWWRQIPSPLGLLEGGGEVM